MKSFFKIIIIVFLAANSSFVSADILSQAKEQNHAKLKKEIIGLSKRVLTQYLIKQREIKAPKNLSPFLLKNQAGLFVTLYVGDEKRGCWGNLYPQRKNIADEIIKNTIKAASKDQRYENIHVSDLPFVTYSVSIVGKIEPINDSGELNPRIYGLLVKKGKKAGVLLPGEAKTNRWQVLECKRLAGINFREEVEMYRFRTILFEL